MKKILCLVLMLCSISRMTYGDVTWSSPAAISTLLTDAADPHVVIDSNGNVTAAWLELDTVITRSLPSGGFWSLPTTLSNPLNTSSSPKLGIDSSGNVTAIWVENGLIETATLPFGGSWTPGGASISGSGAASLSLAIDAAGNAVAVWTRSGFVESSTRISGTWSLVSVLSAANSNSPHVAISNSGTAIATWHSLISGAHAIITDTLTISSNTWATPKNVFGVLTSSFIHNYPKIAIDNSGNATVAWFRYNFLNNNSYQNVQVLTSYLPAGATAWELIPQILSAPGIRNPADLTIKLRYDVNGDALAVWTNSYDGQSFSIESARKLFGANTWPGFIAPQGPTLYSFGIDVAIASGTALLTNMAWDDISSINILSQQTDVANPVNQAWTNINPFSTGDDNAYPQCALSVSGSTFNAAAVWLHFDGLNNVVHTSVGTDSEIAPPTSVSATQNVTDFGVYQDYYNTITWSASTDPNVIQYNIYRNGVIFAQTDPSTLQVIDHNQAQGGTVTYGVAALTSSFRQSPLATFTINP